MSYQVLSRKWRPQVFTDVIGQHHVTDTIQNAIKLNRVAHAYMFCGPRGVGKTTVARILSKAINCTNLSDANPCNKCSNCTEITAGSSLDVLEFDGASNRGIDEIRDLRESVKYPPNITKYKVFIIDEVHMLTKEAFNALLKTLEEPPSHIIFIFATTDPHKVPQTILSRTQRYDLKRITFDLISQHLEKILKNENFPYDNEALGLISKKSEGSLRDALSLLDQVIAYSTDKILINETKDILGIVDENIYLELLLEILRNNPKRTLEILEESSGAGISIYDFMSGYVNFLRSCLLIIYGSKSDEVPLSDKCSEKLKNSPDIDNKKIIQILEDCISTQIDMKDYQQPYIAFETLLLKLSTKDIARNLNGNKNNNLKEKSNDSVREKAKPSDANLKDKGNESVERKTESSSTTLQKEKLEIDLSKENLVSKDYVKSKWSYLVKIIENKNPKIAQFIDDVEIVDLNNESITIKLIGGHSFHLSALEKESGMVEDAFLEVFNNKINLRYEIDKVDNDEMVKKENIEDNSEDHPLFMKAIEDFDGELLR